MGNQALITELGFECGQNKLLCWSLEGSVISSTSEAVIGAQESHSWEVSVSQGSPPQEWLWVSSGVGFEMPHRVTLQASDSSTPKAEWTIANIQ